MKRNAVLLDVDGWLVNERGQAGVSQAVVDAGDNGERTWTASSRASPSTGWSEPDPVR